MGTVECQKNNATTSQSGVSRRGLIGAGFLHVVFFVLAFPPYDLWFLIYLALVPLVWVGLRSAGDSRAEVSRWGRLRVFLMMWLAGTAAYLWIQFWITGVAIMGYPFLCLYLGIYPAMFVALLSRIRRGIGGPSGMLRHLPNVVLVPILWTGLEFFRGDFFMEGYAWFLIGHPSIGWLEMCQSADLLGTYFISFLVATVAGFAGDLLMSGDGGRCGWRLRSVKSMRFEEIGGGRIRSGVLVSATIFVVLNGWNWFYGMGTFSQESTERGPLVTVAVIQSNVPQSNKMSWTNQQQFADFEEMVKLTLAADTWAEAQGVTIDLYAWPETMAPGHAFTDQARTEIQRFEAETGYTTTALSGISGMYYDETLQALALKLGAPLIVGATVLENFLVDTRVETDPNGVINTYLNYDYDTHYNSALLYGADGTPSSQRYDKIKLTPYGEQMPLIHRWPWLQEKMLALGAAGMIFDLASGDKVTPFLIGDDRDGNALRVATPICFESSVAEVCRRLVVGGDESGTGRADLLLNLTNDGWFGDSPGGRLQHLQIGRFRCIENRVPMFRAANTGISAAIDSLGRIIAAGPNIGLEGGDESIDAARAPGALVMGIPLHGRPTVFQSVGQLLGWVMMALTAILGILSFWKGPGAKKNKNSSS